MCTAMVDAIIVPEMGEWGDKHRDVSSRESSRMSSGQEPDYRSRLCRPDRRQSPGVVAGALPLRCEARASRLLVERPGLAGGRSGGATRLDVGVEPQSPRRSPGSIEGRSDECGYTDLGTRLRFTGADGAGLLYGALALVCRGVGVAHRGCPVHGLQGA
jgi:hypothetical protein